VYAHNQPGARTQLWSQLAQFPFPEANWIVAGDFNMRESEEDRSPYYLEKAMGTREQASWNNFALSLGISDTFHHDNFRRINNKSYTWIRSTPSPKWSQLDRFYVNSTIQECGGKQGIWQHMAHLLDHAAIFLQISLHPTNHGPGPIHFNISLLKQQTTKDAIMEAWANVEKESSMESKGEQVAKALQAMMQESTRITRQGKQACKRTYQAQFKEVREEEERLASDGNNLQAWEKLNQAQEKLEEVCMDKIERKKNHMGAI